MKIEIIDNGPGIPEVRNKVKEIKKKKKGREKKGRNFR